MPNPLGILLWLTLLLTGCAVPQPPQPELVAAREALARAYAAGAAQTAAEEYRVAGQALHDGEDQIAAGNHAAARELLPFAARWAHRALFLARLAQEERQRAEEELHRETLATPVPQPPPLIQSEETKPASPPEAPSLPALAKSHTVGDGETLWTIAAERSVYGDPLLWPLLYKANRDQIKDPRHIYPGQVLGIPREVPASEVEEARQQARISDIFPVRKLLPGPSPSPH